MFGVRSFVAPYKGAHSKGAHSKKTPKPKIERSLRPKPKKEKPSQPKPIKKKSPKKEGDSLEHRSPWKIVVIAAVAVVLLAAIGLGVAWLIDFQGKNNARNSLDTVVDHVADIDKTLASVDEAVNSKTTTDTVDTNAKLLKEIPTRLDELASLEATVSSVRSKLRDADKPYANAITDALITREALLTIGEDIVTLDTDASKALSLVNSGWAKLLDAHEKSDAAIASGNAGTYEGVAESLRIDQEVKAELEEAKSEFAQVIEMFPQVDFSAFMSYIDGSLLANQYAIAADEATLASNIAGANEAINNLNAQNDALVGLLAALPKVPTTALDEEYQKQAKELMDRYDSAKKKTADADEQVRRLL